jgi:signal transduction histidine kinase
MNSGIKTIKEILQENKRLTPKDIETIRQSIEEKDGAWALYLEQLQELINSQKRELDIEASLEKVRVSALRMERLEDMMEICRLISVELETLGVKEIRNVQTAIFNEGKGSYMNYEYYRLHQKKLVTDVDYLHNDQSNDFARQMMKGSNATWIKNLEGQPLQDWIAYQKTTNVFIDSFLTTTKSLHYYWHSLGPVAMGMSSYSPLDEQELNLFKKFINVFELAYRRWLDIEKAESRAREAKIEAALERVRAKAMAMQISEDLSEAMALVFDELDKLDMGMLRCGISIINKEKKTCDIWSAVKSGEHSTVQVSGEESMDIHALLSGAYDAWQLNQRDYSYHLKGEDLVKFYEALEKTNFKLPPSQKAGKEESQQDQFFYASLFPAGGLYAFQDTEFSEEARVVIKRFGAVFSLTYTRFRDLQLAEVQTREAKIEAALERVRSKALAMRNSDDLTNTMRLSYHELGLLTMKPRRCGMSLIDRETHQAQIFSANTTPEGSSMDAVGSLDLESHPVLHALYEKWLSREEYHPVISGKELKEYYEILRPQIIYPDYSKDEIQFGNFFFFDEGSVYAWTGEPLSEEELSIYRRFTSVLGLTYKRYQDLAKAESQAKEAIRQASLDRIRAEIASMRTTDDLQKITPSVWRELKAMGVPFFRCGVFIMNEKDQIVHMYLTTPDAKPLGVLHLGFESSEPTFRSVQAWREQKAYTTHWDREKFASWVKSLMGHGQVYAAETYQLGEEPPESLCLQFVPFPQGMLYVGSGDPLNSSQMSLVEDLAKAFSVAYSRYEDFRRLEEAKSQIEITLSRLKATQNQLIQSEKMASLGELTAGIAHEIQNPLNFVNNFSEVSNELLEEMKTELENGDLEDAKSIANDVKENLEKIIHHGKRADGIVKGMLQHSRSSTGQMEKADINALADEYLRLAYHGLRAKDKTFNAAFKTDLDPEIPQINLMPQEFGRVLVNLINNAFYAVTQKKKENIPGYEPTVSVSTKKLPENIELKVRDNGNGIPERVLDKIFQPFFTTKPAGQGTGLGLSLAYDIITKGHGGELKVETKEGEGTEFIISLPIQKTG